MLRQDYYYDNVVIWVFAAFLISYYTRMRIIMTFINIKDGDMWHTNYFLLILWFFFTTLEWMKERSYESRAQINSVKRSNTNTRK